MRTRHNVRFFHDPSQILSNFNGLYPQGFQTPGIVRQWEQANTVLADSLLNAHQIATWFQDDWRITPQLTLNLGVRYDIDLNFYDQPHFEMNATRLALEAIGSPYAELPKTPFGSISPRFGVAYDLSGDGRRVLRGGGGIYWDQLNINGGNISDIYSQNKRPLNVLATRTNTAFGVGELAAFRFGIDPNPPVPSESNSLPRGVCGASFQSPAELYQTSTETSWPRAYATSSRSLSSPICVSHSPSTRV